MLTYKSRSHFGSGFTSSHIALIQALRFVGFILNIHMAGASSSTDKRCFLFDVSAAEQAQPTSRVSFCNKIPRTNKTGNSMRDDDHALYREHFVDCVNLLWRNPSSAAMCNSWLEKRLSDNAHDSDASKHFSKVGQLNLWVVKYYPWVMQLCVYASNVQPMPSTITYDCVQSLWTVLH